MPVRTASQRRKEAKLAYDAFMACCPSRQLLDVLSAGVSQNQHGRGTGGAKGLEPT